MVSLEMPGHRRAGGGGGSGWERPWESCPHRETKVTGSLRLLPVTRARPAPIAQWKRFNGAAWRSRSKRSCWLEAGRRRGPVQRSPPESASPISNAATTIRCGRPAAPNQPPLPTSSAGLNLSSAELINPEQLNHSQSFGLHFTADYTA
eukprot:SAG31_NODE_7773_length_1600_cov_1.189207_1_plen_149_part_00